MKQLKKYENKILLFGDTIVDVNINSHAIGLSLESPTLKCRYESEVVCLGGAANVARHLSELCTDVTFVTSIDPKYTIDNVNLINVESKKYNTKTRYWVNRGDHTYKHLQINDTNSEKVDYTLPGIVVGEAFNVIAISDYRCGLLDRKIAQEVLSTKKSATTYAASQVSSNENNFENYSGFDCFVMNRSEAMQYTSVGKVSYKLFSGLDTKSVYVTEGSRGCSVYTPDNIEHFKTSKVVSKNTIGAGDAFYAAILASDGDVSFANRWASYYVSRNIGDDITLRGLCDYEKSLR